VSLGLSAPLANIMLSAVEPNGYVWVKFHVGNPGATGTANPAAETRRLAVDWGVAADGSMVSALDATLLAVAATETWTHYTLWNDVTAGTFGHSGQLPAGGKAVTAGDDVTVVAGSVSMTFPLAA